MGIRLKDGSNAPRFYGREDAHEQYYCDFGLNPNHERKLDDAGLRIVGVDQDSEAWVVEISELRFFAATLFVPQLNSSPGAPHALITAFLEAGFGNRGSDPGQATSSAASNP